MLPIAGQTAGPNGLKFFEDTQGGCFKLKKFDFFFFKFFLLWATPGPLASEKYRKSENPQQKKIECAMPNKG